jgi:hypothetical protein
VCTRFQRLPQILENVKYANGSPLEPRRRTCRPSPRARSASGAQGRLVIRPSGTERVISVMGEGDNERSAAAGDRRHLGGGAQGSRARLTRTPCAPCAWGAGGRSRHGITNSGAKVADGVQALDAAA